MLDEAVQYYHDLLGDEQVAADSQDKLEIELRRRGLYFGERPLCRVLRPHFYAAADWQYLKAETEIILSAFAKAHYACCQVASLREQLALEPYEEELHRLDADFSTPWPTSRLDSFFNTDTRSLHFVEYNGETPAGIGYGDELTGAFLSLEVMKRFQDRYHVQPFYGMGQLLAALQRGYKESSGHDTPQIGIVDWEDVPTLTEHEICRSYFEDKGVRTIMADPRRLEYRDGALYAGDFRIDLIYKRVLCSELIQRMGMDNAIVHALRNRDVVMLNSFGAKLMAKKASLAFISDENNAHLFDERERAAIAAHIPWTRRVSDRKTLYHGREIDLLEFIADHREQLVLKPNDEYGGKGVVLGWESSSEQWNEAIHDALNHPFVAQERVDGVYRDYPMMVDGSVDISLRWVDADPFVYYGQTVGGCLTRLSSVALLNVTAGGGSVVPMFVVDEK